MIDSPRQHWSAKYIGLPWAAHGRGDGAFDCWGLVRHVYERELNVVLPCLAGDYADAAERSELDRLAAGHGSHWRELPRDAALQPFDLLLFGGAWLHVGLAVGPDRMLHVDRGRLSAIVRLDGPRWKRGFALAARHCQVSQDRHGDRHG